MTECPYCGHRIRKRAPDLEREGDEIKVRESRREKRRRAKAQKQEERRTGHRERRASRLAALSEADVSERPVATIAALLVPAILLIVQRAAPLNADEAGAIVGPVGDEMWRYVTAPFVYVDLGAFIVIGLAIWIFGTAVERRIGTLMTATLILACGTLGMLAADAVASADLIDFLVAGGGNGVALGLVGAWFALARAEGENEYGEGADVLGAAVAAAVLLLLPLVETTADPVAGVVGGLVGLGLGWMAARRGMAEGG